MKTCLLLLLASSFFVRAQDCSRYITERTDKVEGTTFYESKAPMFISADKKTGIAFVFLLSSDKTHLICSISIIGNKPCVEENGKITVLFTDGTRTQIKSQSEYNCRGKSLIYFGSAFENEKILQELMTKKIATMRLYTSEGHIERNFNDKQAANFIASLKCLNEKSLE